MTGHAARNLHEGDTFASGNGTMGAVAATPRLMRAMNERLLLEHLNMDGSVSRPDLARRSGLSKPTVATALANLERDGLVQVAGRRGGVRGPAAVLYEIRPEAGYVLGLDVGRQYVRGALADITGTVQARRSRAVRMTSARHRLAQLEGLGNELVAAAGVELGDITQTVIGSPGVYDPRRGALTMARNLPGWEDPEVVADLQKVFGEATVVENDVDAAALAERDHGYGQDVGTFCVVWVGTGIGMGLVIDGQLHRGAHGAAGEIAFLPVADHGMNAREARHHGQLEAVASAAAVVREARLIGLSGPLSARRVFSAAANGDARALAVVRREANHVARAVTSVMAVVDPELVILGGGIGQAPGFAEAVIDELKTLAPFVPELRASALGDDAVVEGCVASARERAWRRVLERA
jgi:predicted NBD/HSP70 family sugar kinase